MKALPVLTAAVAATLLAAMPDTQAATIRPDLDADTRARLELIERMRASRGIRYFNTTAPTPAPVVVNAPAVYLPPPVAPKPAAPAPSGNCTPATSAAPAAPPASQSVSYVQQVTPATASSGPARSLMSRVSASVAGRARSGQVLAPLFDARSLRLYGPAAGTAATVKVTPYVTPAAAPAAPPAAAPCVPADSSSQAGAKPDLQSTPPAGGSSGSPGDGNPFLDPELLPKFAGNDLDPEQPATGEEPESNLLTSLVDEGGGEGGEFQPLAVPVQSVPEPGSLALLGLGLLGLGWARRRRR